ncbi:MAG: hypothetical protein ABSH03_02010 [Candidatus Lustribacter sp.]|jgi:hypothetical protein
MIAAFLAGMLAFASSGPGPLCPGADISVTDLQIKVIKGSPRTATADRLLITGVFANVGNLAQQPRVAQHAELVRDGSVVAKQPLPALAAGVAYPLQFRIFRDTSQRTDPIEVLVRYVLDDKNRAPRNNCSATNDSLTKTF